MNPTSTGTKPKHMRELPLLVNVANKLSSTFASPLNTDGSADNLISQRFSSFLEKEEVEKLISDISSNIKEGKYHTGMLRMQRIFLRNQHSMMTSGDQISIYRRYFECLRKLSKRYFSQEQLSKQQLSNMLKMCERGMNLIRNWNTVITELLESKNEITAYIAPSQRSIMSQQTIERSPLRIPSSYFKAEADRETKSPLLSPKNLSSIRQQLQRQQEMTKKQNLLRNMDYHINEFLKANLNLLYTWAQLSKKQENIEQYRQMLFRSVQLAQKIDQTQDEELLGCLGKVYLELGNFYLSQGCIKESIKNYQLSLDYLHRTLKILGNNEKHQQLMKLSVAKKKKKQQNVLHNLVMMTCVLHNLSISEELHENYSRVLESLSIAEWLSSLFLAQSYPELDKTISEALDTAKGKYKDLVLEEGEIYIIMDEALGFRDEKKKKKEENKVEDNDFYSYYIPKRNSQILIQAPPSPTMSDTPSSRNTQNNPGNIQNISPRVLINSLTSPSSHSVNVVVPSNGHHVAASVHSSLHKYHKNQVQNKQQSLIEESLSQYKVESQSRITKDNSKNASYSLNRTRPQTSYNQSSFFNNTILGGMTTPQNSSTTRTPQQTTFVSRTISHHSFTNSFSKPAIYIGQGDDKDNSCSVQEIVGMSNTNNYTQTRNPSPSSKQRLFHAHNLTATSLLGNNTTVMSNRNWKPDSKKVTSTIVLQPKILTTDKYFDDSKAVFYSAQKDDQFFVGKKKMKAAKMEQKQKVKQLDNDSSQPRKEQQAAPIVVQTLDEFFEEKLNNELNNRNDTKMSASIKYQEVVNGVSFIMKDEQFDKEEFGQASKLLKFKCGSDQLFASFRKKENPRSEPKQSKAQALNQFHFQIDDQESQQNLKLLLSNAKAYKKEYENQRLAKNLIQTDFDDEPITDRISSQNVLTKKVQSNLKTTRETTSKKAIINENPTFKGRTSFQRNSLEKNSNLNPKQLAKNMINQEIEQIDAQLKSEEREMQELRLPRDRRSCLSNDQKQKNSKQLNETDEIIVSPKGLVSGMQPHKQQISDHNLRFLEEYKRMADSTRMISQKKEARKGLNFADVVLSAYSSMKQQNFTSNKQQISTLNQQNTTNDQKIGQNKKLSSSKATSAMSVSIRKLMRLKTSDLEEPKSVEIPQNINSNRSKDEKQMFQENNNL